MSSRAIKLVSQVVKGIAQQRHQRYNGVASAGAAAGATLGCALGGPAGAAIGAGLGAAGAVAIAAWKR